MWTTLAAIAAVWTGCSAQAPAGRKAAGVEVGSEVEARDRAEVAELYDAINREMVAMRSGAYRPPVRDDVASGGVAPSEPTGTPDRRPPGTKPRCVQVASAICTSSSRICDIATRHPEEPYFTDKCNVATISCQEASAVCTSNEAKQGDAGTNTRVPLPPPNTPAPPSEAAGDGE